ncbi:M28 family peptidase [Vitiosangium sp. GDMCC 1.1324]|uniref:M28 family peptidase n=1 Tax=Vitiosangium sp. (strain GDMCC 1.1324) TaxID=2138576 RepID=UPI000D3B6E18|nr:M28 family peptidase [Vitiosangium sp. GDMCC 1.1324]PTL81672.1 peptidase M28 [Vitiosangium sp. GDMCC 1.1324]
MDFLRNPRRRNRVLGLLAGLVALVAAACWLKSPSPEPVATRCTPGHVDPERLKAHVRTLSETFHPRDHRHPENLERAAGYISDALSRAGGHVRSEPYTAGTGSYRNVIATFGPDSEERLVIGAHYDAAEGAPGADDNASGVAGLLELAAWLGEHPPPMRVDLVGFTLEEPPHFRRGTMGSKVHARALRSQDVKVRAMLSVESIGYFSQASGSQEYPVAALKLRYPTEGNFIAVVGRSDEKDLIHTVHQALRAATDLPSESLAAPRGLEGVDFSDHASFWDERYPAVMLTDTALFRNTHYHTPEDTWDTLDYARMAKVVQGVQCAIDTLGGQSVGGGLASSPK